MHLSQVADILARGAAAYGLSEPDSARLALFERFLSMLLSKNEVMNLTAITDPAEAAYKHYLDSLSLFSALPLHGQRVVDVGCGAGFPGLPLKLYDDSIELTLLDSLGKRVDFLREAVAELGLSGVDCVHARAEEGAAAGAPLRERFDIACSRAVAALPVLCELCLPYVRPGGVFAAMKSAGSDEELGASAHAVRVLGGRLERVFDYTIPGTDIRHRLILIRKAEKTPAAYPRRFAKIKQSPL